MTYTDYTKILLNIKDPNIHLYENFLETKKLKVSKQELFMPI